MKTTVTMTPITMTMATVTATMETMAVVTTIINKEDAEWDFTTQTPKMKTKVKTTKIITKTTKSKIKNKK